MRNTKVRAPLNQGGTGGLPFPENFRDIAMAKSSTTARSRARPKSRKWSATATRDSDALDLERSVFSKEKPADIARSLKRSAERSHRRKSAPYRSAMSMLTFYINRAGKNLPKRRLRVLEQAKDELRRAFGRE
jgi:hypothetical protein